MLDQMDMYGSANSKRKWKPLTRPYRDSTITRFGYTELPPDEAIALLRRNAGRSDSAP